MDTIGKFLQRYRVLGALAQLVPPGGTCHLVGGVLRDALLGRASSDFDFTTPDDPTPLAKALARALGGRWFLLDRARHQSRVLLTLDGRALTCDFAPWRGPTLGEDLRLRDFTLNALAWPLGGNGEQARLLDPLDGEGDLRRGLLRHCSEQAFTDDPLRLLRGVRLVGQFGWELTAETLTLMRAARAELSRVAAERIRQELAGIFASDRLPQALALLQELGLADPLFGQALGMDFALFRDRLQRLDRRLPQLDATFAPQVGAVGELLTDGFTRAGVFRLATLLRALHPGGQLPAELRRWRLSRSGQQLLQHLLTLPADPAGLITTIPGTQRGQALWVEQFGATPGELLRFLAAAWELAEAELATLEAAFAAYRQLALQGRVPDLLSGDWVRTKLGISDGPQLGQALEQLRQAEREGRVKTRAEGEKLLKSIGEKSVDRSGGQPYNRPHVERE